MDLGELFAIIGLMFGSVAMGFFSVVAAFCGKKAFALSMGFVGLFGSLYLLEDVVLGNDALFVWTALVLSSAGLLIVGIQSARKLKWKH